MFNFYQILIQPGSNFIPFKFRYNYKASYILFLKSKDKISNKSF